MIIAIVMIAVIVIVMIVIIAALVYGRKRPIHCWKKRSGDAPLPAEVHVPMIPQSF